MESEFLIPDETALGQAIGLPNLSKDWTDWSVWTFTELDRHIRQGLPVQTYLKQFHPCDDLEESQKLLADCLWAESM